MKITLLQSLLKSRWLKLTQFLTLDVFLEQDGLLLSWKDNLLPASSAFTSSAFKEEKLLP